MPKRSGIIGSINKAPLLPLGVVIGWLLEGAEVAIGPSDPIAISLEVALSLCGGTDHGADIPSNGWFFADTEDHG